MGGQGRWRGDPPLPEGSSILAGRDPPAGQPGGAARRPGVSTAHWARTAAGGTPGRTRFYWALNPQALVSPGVVGTCCPPSPPSDCPPLVPLFSRGPSALPQVHRAPQAWQLATFPEASRAKAEQEGLPWQGWAG